MPENTSDSPEWFDTHCHLNLGKLAHEPEKAWERARIAGVTRALVIGIDSESSLQIHDWIGNRKGLFGCVGIHPNSTDEATPTDFECIESLAGKEKIVAVGESGVDLYWDRAPLSKQQSSLEWHANLAIEHKLPLVLHIRDAFRECAEVLKNFANTPLKAIVHSFAGGPTDLEPYLSWGYWISFSGMLTYPKAQELRDAAALVPIHRCLVETDAPYLPPQPVRGKMNEPAYVVHTGHQLARIKGLSTQELALRTTQNALELFRIQDE